jgi:Flp pilus assembly protein TadG
LIRSQKGQATVELAITITILVFIFFIIIDFGRIFHAYLTLEHAGREGARVTSLNGTDTEVIQRIKESSPSLDPDNIIISITPTIENRTRGTYATINLSYPLQLSTPLFQDILPNPIVIKTKTVMRVE